VRKTNRERGDPNLHRTFFSAAVQEHQGLAHAIPKYLNLKPVMVRQSCPEGFGRGFLPGETRRQRLTSSRTNRLLSLSPDAIEEAFPPTPGCFLYALNLHEVNAALDPSIKCVRNHEPAGDPGRQSGSLAW
jgi:hypothetical protein